MSRQIADNLSYKGQQFLDERERVSTIAELSTLFELYYPDGFVAFCEEDGCFYEYRSDNVVDPTTGKWTKIGHFVNHPETVVGGVPQYFSVHRGTINAGSSIPGGTPGSYWTIDPAQSVPFQIGAFRFTRKNQALYVDQGGNVVLTTVPNEYEVHVFQDPSVSYYKKPDGTGVVPAYIYKKYVLSDKALAAGFAEAASATEDGGARFTFKIRDMFYQGTASVRLGNWAYYSASSDFVITTTGVVVKPGTTDEETFEYADIDVKKMISFEQSGYVKKIDTAELFLINAAEKVNYICHIKNDKSFDNYGNITEVPKEGDMAIGLVSVADINDMIATKCLVEDYAGSIVLVGLYGTDKLVDNSTLLTSTTPSGWVFDAEGYWRKIFPADIALDRNSQAPVANGIVTRSIAKAGHTINVEFEKGIKVLTVALNDKDGNELNRMAVCIGEEDSAAPKAALTLEEDLYDKSLGAQDVEITVKVTKGNSDVKKVEIKNLTTGDIIKTFEGAEIKPDEPECDYVFTYNTDESAKLQAIAYDVDEVTGTSESVPYYFVKPCKYNPDGQATFTGMDDYLTKDGYCRIIFDFGTNVAQPSYLIPKEIHDEHPVTAIIGGNTEEELYTNYTESFTHDQYTDTATGDVYERYFLTTPCNLNDYYFEFRVENN